jgi:hypothetical protein
MIVKALILSVACVAGLALTSGSAMAGVFCVNKFYSGYGHSGFYSVPTYVPPVYVPYTPKAVFITPKPIFVTPKPVFIYGGGGFGYSTFNRYRYSGFGYSKFGGRHHR